MAERRLPRIELPVDERLRLKPLVAEYADALDAVIAESRAELARWLPWVEAHRGPDDLRAYIALVDERRSRALAETTFAIFYDGAPIGAIELHGPTGLHDVTSVGYWLGTGFTGRGIMTKSLVRFSDFAFEAHEIRRLELYAVVDNLKSRRVAERAGFTFEAVLRNRLKLGGDYLDAALYARFPEKK